MTSCIDNLEKATQLQQSNQPHEALRLYHSVLKKEPNNPYVLQGTGLAYAQIQEFGQAIEYFKKAIQLSPTIAAFHNNLANAYKKTNQFEAALSHYFEALKLKSPYPEVHNNLGSLYYQQAKIDEAIAEFEKSLRMAPHQINTHYHLATCYIHNNRLLEAIPHFEAVLAEQPNHLPSLYNLGIARTVLKDFKAAQPLLEKVIEQETNNIEALFHLAITQSALANIDKAEIYYLKIIQLNPYHAQAHHNLATIYLNKSNQNKALEHYQHAFDYDPNNVTAQHMINALTGIASSQGAPEGYIAALFDQYAYNYNQHLTEQLEYKLPSLLREIIAPIYAHFSPKLLNILDLGCGTGLCGAHFRDIAANITGVDISTHMIKLAKEQNIYDHLIESSINSYLNNVCIINTFDLIIAADVFVYFADLKAVFEQCYNALKPNGLFIFSIEINDATQDTPYQLLSSGRYSHTPLFIEQLACELNFSIPIQKKVVLRKNHQEDVWGMIFVFLKTPHSCL